MISDGHVTTDRGYGVICDGHLTSVEVMRYMYVVIRLLKILKSYDSHVICM